MGYLSSWNQVPSSEVAKSNGYPSSLHLYWFPVDAWLEHDGVSHISSSFRIEYKLPLSSNWKHVPSYNAWRQSLGMEDTRRLKVHPHFVCASVLCMFLSHTQFKMGGIWTVFVGVVREMMSFVNHYGKDEMEDDDAPVYSASGSYIRYVQMIVKNDVFKTGYEMEILAAKISSLPETERMWSRDTKFVSTKTSNRIFDLMFRMTSSLVAGRLRYTIGTASCLVTGANKSGKSTSLIQFVSLCSAVFPSCVALYIDFRQHQVDILRSSTIMEIVERFLRKRHWIFPTGGGGRHDSRGTLVLEGLAKAGKKLVLVCDHIDAMYEVDSQTTRLNLNDLNLLGNTSMGVVVTVLCGSSAWSPSLIRAEGPSAQFPLLTQKNNLNDSKFRTIWVEPDFNIQERHGARSENIDSFLFGSEFATQEALRYLPFENPFSFAIQMPTLKWKFYEMLVRGMFSKNEKRVTALFESKIGWENMRFDVLSRLKFDDIQPIGMEFVEACWNKSNAGSRDDMYATLFDLSDNSLVVLKKNPVFVYPSSLYVLICFYLRSTPDADFFLRLGSLYE